MNNLFESTHTLGKRTDQCSKSEELLCLRKPEKKKCFVDQSSESETVSFEDSRTSRAGSKDAKSLDDARIFNLEGPQIKFFEQNAPILPSFVNLIDRSKLSQGAEPLLNEQLSVIRDIFLQVCLLNYVDCQKMYTSLNPIQLALAETLFDQVFGREELLAIRKSQLRFYRVKNTRKFYSFDSVIKLRPNILAKKRIKVNEIMLDQRKLGFKPSLVKESKQFGENSPSQPTDLSAGIDKPSSNSKTSTQEASSKGLPGKEFSLADQYLKRLNQSLQLLNSIDKDQVQAFYFEGIFVSLNRSLNQFASIFESPRPIEEIKRCLSGGTNLKTKTTRHAGLSHTNLSAGNIENNVDISNVDPTVSNNLQDSAENGKALLASFPLTSFELEILDLKVNEQFYCLTRAL